MPGRVPSLPGERPPCEVLADGLEVSAGSGAEVAGVAQLGVDHADEVAEDFDVGGGVGVGAQGERGGGGVPVGVFVEEGVADGGAELAEVVDEYGV